MLSDQRVFQDLEILIDRRVCNSALGSTGGIQQGLHTLSRKDLIEKDYRTGVWSVVDPVFVCWLIEMSL
ncbi:MAG: hypothetical protein U9N19_04905 [Thermodesulfobacteriota bacterium]|nr:hypothetical protein [Thermodesulfobacteriota bacterium]